MQKALVLGGTRFFGVNLVKELLDKGIDVTIATRGEKADPFGDRVNRIVFDRTNFDSFKESFKDSTWDMVFDQICYTAKDALEAIEVFSGKTKRYIMTSTLSVYDLHPTPFIESDYDPYQYEIVEKGSEEVNYQEGKRQAEAVFFQKAPFPVAAVRIPIVLGENDYTGRLAFHVERVAKGEEIFFVNPESSICFISEDEAGKFIAWIGTSDYTGPVNACSHGTVTLKELLLLIEHRTGKKTILAKEGNETNQSPYNLPCSWTMNNNKAVNLGFKFSNLEDWLPRLLDKLAKNY